MQFDGANPNNWQQIWFVPQIPVVSHDKFTRIVCPVVVETPIIAISFNLATILSPWQFCGYLSREMASGLIVGGGQSNSRLGTSLKIFGNKLQVFTFRETVSYSLVFDSIIKGQGSISAWEYTGVIT